MDRLTAEQRRRCMRAVRCKDTKPELILRKALWALGYRYRLNVKTLPGKPDLVFPKYKIVIFCDGAFWHGYDWENKKHEIKSRQEFWFAKIEGNMARDRKVNEKLTEMGWTVLRFLDFQIKKDLQVCIDLFLDNTD